MLIRDIASLVVVPPGPLAGAAMRDVDTIEDAALLIEDGRIAWFGRGSEAAKLKADEVLSARGGCVIPGLIDPHTHIPFAGQRAGEFARRIAGESYLSIMESGGGIRVTTQAVRQASEDELVELNLPRLGRMLAFGVTTCECKSGYGLAPEHELKQLRAIRKLDRLQPIELISTYLGAHALPAEYEGRVNEFIEVIGSAELLRQIAAEKLADFCDVFCDRGAFDVAQTRRVLERARQAGLKLKLHADELAQIGATRLAGELLAVSADHLETIDEGGIAALKNSGTVAVALPGTSFFLGIEHCNVRRLIDAGTAGGLVDRLQSGFEHDRIATADYEHRLLPATHAAGGSARGGDGQRGGGARSTRSAGSDRAEIRRGSGDSRHADIGRMVLHTGAQSRATGAEKW